MTKVNQEVKTLIIHCIVQRLDEVESLEYLARKGHNIKRSTFYNTKKKIIQSRFTRMREIADTGYIDYHLDAIDTLEWAKREMVNNYNNETDPYKKQEMLTQIINTLPFFAEYIAESKQVIENKAISQSQTDKETITI